MKVVSYRLELDELRHPILVHEKDINYEVNSLTHPEDVVNLCNKMMRLNSLAEENVIAICVDNKNSVLGIFRVSHGTANFAVCNPREVFIRALVVGASGFFLVHNHPSGNPNPSKDDLDCMERMKKTGNLIGIKLIDFLIVGENAAFSAQSGECI